MRSDIERWNRKYTERNPHPTFEPDAILVRHRDLLSGNGNALDVACGVGHNAIYLAQLGYDVIGVDGSIVGLEHGRQALQDSDLSIQLIAMDLTDFMPPREFFDVIVVIRFLDRVLIPRLKDALRPGGLILYETFNRNLLKERPSFNEDFLLELEELAAFFEGFDLVKTNDSEDLAESLTHWIGRKPQD